MALLAGSLLDSIEVYTMVEKGHSIKALDVKRKVKLSQNPKECFCKKYHAVSDIFTRSYFILRGLESRNLEFFN